MFVQVCNSEMPELTKRSTVLFLGSVSIWDIDHGILPAIAPSISKPTSLLIALQHLRCAEALSLFTRAQSLDREFGIRTRVGW